MQISATELRGNMYKVLDKILESGEPVDIKRKGQLLRISPIKPSGKLKHLKPIKGLIIGDPSALDEIDWSKEWKP